MRPLKILHVEDSPTDSELLSTMLDQAYEVNLVRVDSEAAFLAALESQDIDLIISDFSLPSYSGSQALEVARSRRPDLPFICFSGTIGEDAAIEALRAGATDYVLKHRPQRMHSAVERALRERDERWSRLEAEAALHRREEEFRTLIENALDVIAVIDPEGLFKYNSPSVERVLGYKAAELNLTNVFGLVHPEDQARAQAAFQEARQIPNKCITAEFRVRHQNGSWRNLELIGKSFPPGSAIEGVVINSRDVTEKRQTEAQLLRAQRMECLGVLAGGIAHDLNNILSPILMGSELLKTYVSDPEALGVIETIQASSERGSDIVKQVLSFARGVKGDTTSFDLKPLVYEVLKLLRETFPKSIQLQTWFPEELHSIICNRTELHQVLMNLCVNARDAMPDGGLLQIKAQNVDYPENPKQHSGVPGKYVRLTISDSGTGIPAELLSRIFEPFFTTKEEGKGTGLGLSTVLSIVKRNGGFLEVQSEIGEGTTFHIYLRAGQPEDVAENAQQKQFEDGEHRRILLVDDESAILEMTRLVLENSNYEVIVASEGVQALRTMLAEPERWDLLITDVSMPIMDGPALVKEVHRIFGKIPVLCTTGQGSANLRDRIIAAGVDLIIDKPYTAEQLLGAVSAVLKKSRPRSEFLPENRKRSTDP
jgi:two-component system, cell cycle sensor histidine kinase and response regulator CckA